MRNDAEQLPAVHSADTLAARLHYDAATGVLTWRVSPSRKVSAGSVAGRIRPDGYRVIGLGGARYYAHQIAFYIGHNRWPTEYIDHINGDRSDNRLENLREVTPAQSNMNKTVRKDSGTKLKGVYFSKRDNRWRARIVKDGAQISLGTYDTAEGAQKAYAAAEQELFGQYRRQS